MGLACTTAHAFTLETAVSAGCHERMTLEALNRAGWPNGQVEPPATAEHEAWLANMPFHLPAGTGAWSLALVVGVRSNDLHGVAPTSFPEFAEAQLAEGAQEEHCLRTAAEDFTDGDVEAVARCRAFVLERLSLALGAAEVVDVAETEPVRVALRYQDTQLALSRFGYRVGQALHAIQDSYTHTLRSKESSAVLHVFNFVDPALSKDYSLARDGFGHVSKFDDCEGTDDAERARVDEAIAASTAMLVALSGPAGRTARLAEAQRVLDTTMQYQPGCTPDNLWCHAADTELPRSGCSSTPGLSVLALLAWLRRRARVAVASALVSASIAQASPWSGYVGAGLSVDRAAVSADLGVRLAVHPRVRLGFDVEFNPWFDILSASAAPGALNAYASGSWLWLETGRVALRSVLKAGGSVLLFDVVGAHAGSVGVFVGASLLGVSIELVPGLRLVVDPLEVDVAVPSLKGVPFAFRQYRLSVGVEHQF